MTNNNWEEEVKKIAWYLGCSEKELWSEISKILTKKDQEHKAELEMIRGKVQDMREEGEGDLRSVISILDIHINKLSTE